MKRTISLILILSILVLSIPLSANAEGEVFIAMGNTVLPLTDAMPIKSGGVWYIDYQSFSGGAINVNSSYNASERKLVLYTWDTTLIFDLNTSTAHTVHDNVQYKAVTITAAGTVYVPVQFTAQILGLEFSYLPEIPLIRVKRTNDIPNNMFKYIAKNSVPDLLSAYNKKKAEENKLQQPADSSQNSTQTTAKTLRLTFNISNGQNLGKILNSLSRYNFKATFFVSENVIADYGNELRRIVTGGHSLGILASDIDKLSSANRKLFDVTKQKTRLVRFSDGSSKLSSDNVEKVISLGYRLWDSNVSNNGTSSQIYSRTVSQLKNSSRSPVVALSDSTAHYNSLSQILKYLRSENYVSYAINLLDTPVNQISERR